MAPFDRRRKLRDVDNGQFLKPDKQCSRSIARLIEHGEVSIGEAELRKIP